MKISILFIILISSFLVFNSCNDSNTNSQPENPTIISSRNIPCQGDVLAKTTSGKGVGFSWEKNGNNLLLDFKYTGNCAAIFIDSTLYNNDYLSVNIKNTSFKQVRCICEFGTQVSINMGIKNSIRIVVLICPYPKDNYTLELDTILNIQSNLVKSSIK